MQAEFAAAKPTQCRKRSSSPPPEDSEPESLPKNQAKGTKKKKVKKQRTVSSPDERHDDETEDDMPKKKASKKKKKKRTRFTDDEDEDDASKMVTVYIEIEGPGHTSSSKKTPGPKPIQRGPFFLDAYADFTHFKHLLAKNTPCNVKLLVVSQLAWKFDVPKNSSRKTLNNNVGYDAMCAALKVKKGDVVIHVYMPPPKKDDVRSPPSEI